MRAKNWQKPLPWLVVAALLVLWEVCVRASTCLFTSCPAPSTSLKPCLRMLAPSSPTRWSRSRGGAGHGHRPRLRPFARRGDGRLSRGAQVRIPHPRRHADGADDRACPHPHHLPGLWHGPEDTHRRSDVLFPRGRQLHRRHVAGGQGLCRSGALLRRFPRPGLRAGKAARGAAAAVFRPARGRHLFLSGAVVGEWIGSQSGLGYYLLRVKESYSSTRCLPAWWSSSF